MLPRRLFFFWVKEKLVRFYQFLSIRLRSASCVTRCASRCLYSCNTLSTNAHHRLRCSRRTQPRLRGARNREHRRASIRRCFFLFHCSVHCSTKSVLVRRRRCWYRPSLVRKTCCYTCDHRRQSVSTVGVTAGFIPRILDYGTKMGNFMHQSQKCTRKNKGMNGSGDGHMLGFYNWIRPTTTVQSAVAGIFKQTVFYHDIPR